MAKRLAYTIRFCGLLDRLAVQVGGLDCPIVCHFLDLYFTFESWLSYCS